jgi:pyridinium-3,5-bisthiocarboxylic acid mononucleotide nickel chelatase
MNTRICHFDPFSGISGDMTVGALIDAGAEAAAVFAALESLGLGATYAIEPVKRRGLGATKFRVAGGETKAHRHLPQVEAIIQRGALSERAKQDALKVFHALAVAEANVHRVPMQKVHFHEVGAVDSISDIVGACVALDLLGVQEVTSSAINTGSGTVTAEHGVMPVPAPATAALLEGKPVYARGPATELTTPTGAAILAALGSHFGPMPAARIVKSGFGAGDKDFPEHANVLRAIIAEKTGASESTTVSIIESNIDDSTPEVLGYAMERLMREGALDVSYSPLQMKKNRPASLLRVIAREQDRERLAEIVFAETSTAGLRIYAAERRVRARQMVEVDLGYGKVQVKVTESGVSPEYDQCRALAESTGKPLKVVMADAVAAHRVVG